MQQQKKHTLYYDHECPVCRSFAKLLRKKLGDRCLFANMSSEQKEEYQEFVWQKDGVNFSGKDAIEKMEKDFPEIKEFFWMLPGKYRSEALVRSWKFAKWLRKTFGPCECCNK
jgi:predicted DCC family thiol-disulfide oxidoreductase YuxK